MHSGGPAAIRAIAWRTAVRNTVAATALVAVVAPVSVLAFGSVSPGATSRTAGSSVVSAPTPAGTAATDASSGPTRPVKYYIVGPPVNSQQGDHGGASTED
jgi:hypothetical protein